MVTFVAVCVSVTMPWFNEMCFDTKQEWRLTIESKMLELFNIVFLSCRFWFLIWTFFVMKFLFRLALLLFLHCVCIHLNCYITNVVHTIMCVLPWNSFLHVVLLKCICQDGYGWNYMKYVNSIGVQFLIF